MKHYTPADYAVGPRKSHIEDIRNRRRRRSQEEQREMIGALIFVFFAGMGVGIFALGQLIMSSI